MPRHYLAIMGLILDFIASIIGLVMPGVEDFIAPLSQPIISTISNIISSFIGIIMPFAPQVDLSYLNNMSTEISATFYLGLSIIVLAGSATILYIALVILGFFVMLISKIENMHF